MFGSLLFVLSTLGAVPAGTMPLVTCARPVAKLVAPQIEHVAGATRSTDGHQITLWLRRWEQTARRRPALSAARRDVLRHRVETNANAHAAMALELMTGPLDVTRLRESFVWTITDRDAGRIQLEATPRDETERLFYGSIRVSLDESDGTLNQLQVVNRSSETRFVWKNEFTPEPSRIRLVSATDDSPAPINGVELPSPLAPIPMIAPPAEEHNCANGPKTLPDSSTSDISPREQATNLWAWLFVPPTPGLEAPDPTDLSAVTPELEAILSQWEAASRRTTAVHAAFKRTVSNSVFETEKRSEGRITYQAPHSMTVVFQGDKLARGRGGRGNGKGGFPYRMEADRSETCVWTEKSFTWANDEDQTYEVVELPPHERLPPLTVPSWLFGPFQQRLPFLFDIRSEQLRREWSLTLTKSTDGKAVIEATPRTAMLKQWFSRCFVKLDTKEWHLDAVKYIDPTQNLETVYVIQDWRTNPKNSTGWNWGPSFIDFKTRGYKRIAPP